MNNEMKFTINGENVDKIDRIKTQYKELGFDYYDNNLIVNMLLSGKRYPIKAKDESHFWELIEFENERINGENRRWARSVTVICDFGILGNYLAIYDEGLTECQEDEVHDLTFEPCELVDTYIKKTKWIQNG